MGDCCPQVGSTSGRHLPDFLRAASRHGASGRTELYRRSLDLFARGITVDKESCERADSL
jgi:hypothetical protein